MPGEYEAENLAMLRNLLVVAASAGLTGRYPLGSRRRMCSSVI